VFTDEPLGAIRRGRLIVKAAWLWPLKSPLAFAALSA
jgi:hypothetical protein